MYKSASITDKPQLNFFLRHRQALIVLIILAALTVLRLWMMSAQTLWVADSGFDDGLFMKQALSIQSGHWMGLYSQMCLIKGPGYPLWLALVSGLRIPILLAQHLFSLGAVWAVVLALRPRIEHPFLLIVVFIFLAFNPVSMGSGSWTVLRDSIYPDQCLLAAACLLGVATRLEASYRVQWAWGLAAGISLGWVYISREEGAWMAPLVLIVMLYVMSAAWKLRHAIGRWNWLAVPAVTLGTTACVLVIICLMNFRHYRMFGVVETKEAAFTAALGAVARPFPAHWYPMVPVPRDTWKQLYAVSPAFAELKPFLEGQNGDSWTSISERSMPALAGTREIAGGWWLWAFRDAAALAGHYRNSNRETRDYYRRMADEINAAVDAGKLPGGPKRSGISPPWHWAYVGLMRQSFPELWNEWVWMPKQSPKPEVYYSLPEKPELDRFAAVFHEQVLPHDVDPADPAYVPAAQRRYMQDVRFGMLTALHRAYQLAAPVLLALLCGCMVALRVHRGWRKTCAALWIFVAGVLAAAALRAALLLYIEVSSFPAASNPRYIAASQVYLMLGEILVIVIVADRVWAAFGMRAKSLPADERGSANQSLNEKSLAVP